MCVVECIVRSRCALLGVGRVHEPTISVPTIGVNIILFMCSCVKACHTLLNEAFLRTKVAINRIRICTELYFTCIKSFFHIIFSYCTILILQIVFLTKVVTK